MVSYNRFLMLFSVIFLMSHVNCTITELPAGQQCSDHVFGCEECHVHTKTVSCTRCSPNLYLYKYRNPNTDKFINICVTDCKKADFQSVNDEVNKQCIYLGPFCAYDHIVTNSATKKPVPSCKKSFMNDKGYVLGSRYQIMNWMRNVASPKNLDIS